jgi:hypothetical protein
MTPQRCKRRTTPRPLMDTKYFTIGSRASARSAQCVFLLEIDELVNAEFVPQGLDSNFKQDSVFIWQNIYFKLWVLFLILAEWIIRKFKELR